MHNDIFTCTYAYTYFSKTSDVIIDALLIFDRNIYENYSHRECPWIFLTSFQLSLQSYIASKLSDMYSLLWSSCIALPLLSHCHSCKNIFPQGGFLSCFFPCAPMYVIGFLTGHHPDSPILSSYSALQFYVLRFAGSNNNVTACILHSFNLYLCIRNLDRPVAPYQSKHWILIRCVILFN